MAKKASVGEVRAWAKQHGFALGDRGRLPTEVWDAWNSRNSPTKPGPVPQQRATAPEPVAAKAEELEAAQTRIARLEQQVAQLTDRLADLESRPAEPKRRFARSR